MKEVLGFPDYYGNNFSALYDVLTETDLETRIEVNLEEMPSLPLAGSLNRMIQVIEDAQEENDRIHLVVVR